MFFIIVKLLVFFQKFKKSVQVLRVNKSKVITKSDFNRFQFGMNYFEMFDHEFHNGKKFCIRYWWRLLTRSLMKRKSLLKKNLIEFNLELKIITDQIMAKNPILGIYAEYLSCTLISLHPPLTSPPPKKRYIYISFFNF